MGQTEVPNRSDKGKLCSDSLKCRQYFKLKKDIYLNTLPSNDVVISQLMVMETKWVDGWQSWLHKLKNWLDRFCRSPHSNSHPLNFSTCKLDFCTRCNRFMATLQRPLQAHVLHMCNVRVKQAIPLPIPTPLSFIFSHP